MPRLPSPTEIARRILERAKAVWYLAEDVGYATGRLVSRAGAGVGDLWWGLGLRARRRIAGLLGILALAAIVVLLVVPSLPCQFPGGDECPPEDEALELVPGNALAYVHANVDPESQQYEDAAVLAKRLRTITDLLITRLPAPTGTALDYKREVAPWLGGEGALASLRGERGDTEQVALLEVADAEGAERFADQLTGGGAEREEHRHVDLRIGAAGLTTALTSGFLVVGPEDAVRSVLDVAEGPARPLDDSEQAIAALDALPEHRLAEAYVSEDGIGALLAPDPSLAPLEAFVNFQASTGAAAALVTSERGIEVEVHSTLDAERQRSAPWFFGALPPFEPTLAGEVSESALGYLAVGNPEQSIKGLLAQATAQAPALASGFEEFGDRLADAGGVSLEKEVLPLLEAEAAVAVEPSPGVPYLSLIVGDVDEERARRTLAQLQGPIAEALEPEETAQAPVFSQREVDGVNAQSVRISPTVNLTYAVFDGMLVVSTDPAGVKQVRSGESTLNDSSLFQEATDGFPDEVSALLYLNLGELVKLAEREGLAADPSYALFAPEIRRLQALAVAVERAEESLDTRVRLAIGE